MNKIKTITTGIAALVAVALLFVYVNYFKTYTVTFEVKIGAGIPTQEVVIGHTVTKPADPTREGYEFKGWYLDDTEYDFNKKVTKNITLIAKWEKVE